jgi:protein tyrosine/serine phosphatase
MWRMVGRIKLRVRKNLTRITCYFAILALLAGASSATADVYLGANSSSPPQKSNRTKFMQKNLPNFSEVTTTLYRGGQPSKQGFHTLAKMGINIVVDVRGSRESERKLVTHLGMQYVPMPWECSFPKDKTFAQFLRLIQDNPGKKIFVHCHIGDDRTGMMIASFRMAREGWSADRAEKEMEKFGFNFAHRRLICPRLSSYEEDFPEHFRTRPEFRDLR